MLAQFSLGSPNFEARNPKFETISNDQNPKLKNKQLIRFRSLGNLDFGFACPVKWL
jgi:hypothetical protein